MTDSPPVPSFCQQCGGAVRLLRLPQDEVPRHVCVQCAAVHYRNPRVVVGTLATWHDRVLLCRRAVEPRRGRWTIPAGYLELGETPEQGAARETREEAQASVRVGPLYDVHTCTAAGQLYLTFLGQLASGTVAPGAESLEARLFRRGEIPWDQLCHRAVGDLLARFLDGDSAPAAPPVPRQPLRSA